MVLPHSSRVPAKVAGEVIRKSLLELVEHLDDLLNRLVNQLAPVLLKSGRSRIATCRIKAARNLDKLESRSGRSALA